MKVGIITLHNSFNFGGVLQALATQKALAQLGHRPEIVNLDTLPYLWKRYKLLLGNRPENLLFNIRRAVPYLSTFRKMNIARTPYPKRRVHYDAAVIGSDELWNVRNPTFHHSPEFFGNGVDANRIVAYAVSCGQSTYEDLVDYPGARDGLRRMHALSGRDDNTIEVVRRLTGRLPAKVLDPTFLVDFTADEEPAAMRGFILVYGYRFSQPEIEATLAFARRQRKPLVSAGFRHPWCDRSVIASPLQFLGLVRAADHVVTNTFHGTVFSIIYRKSFGTFILGKIKVQSLLGDLGLSARGLDAHADIEAAVLSGYDEAAVAAVLDERRAASLAFLREALADEADGAASVRALAADRV